MLIGIATLRLISLLLRLDQFSNVFRGLRLIDDTIARKVLVHNAQDRSEAGSAMSLFAFDSSM